VQSRVNGIKSRYEANQKAMADLKTQLTTRAAITSRSTRR